MNKKIKLLFYTTIFLIFTNLVFAESSRFIDFSKVLNQSKAGAEAQVVLKKKLDSALKDFKKTEESLKTEEKKLIAQRKIISKEEYQVKLEELRKKVFSYQKSKEKRLNDIAKLRAGARSKLLANLNPVIKKYMEENKVRLVLDKKAVLLGDSKLEITKEIIEILNKELTSLNIK